ncbi:unnamed protein product, partial [Schistosoma turkestanicum]
ELKFQLQSALDREAYLRQLLSSREAGLREIQEKVENIENIEMKDNNNNNSNSNNNNSTFK